MRDWIKKIWNLKTEKAVNKSMREKALKGLAAFLIFMFLLTLFSRAANAITIPRVSTDTAQKRSIEHGVRVEGTVEPLQEKPILSMEELKIQSVLVQAGTKVQKGDPLVQLDQEDLDKKVKELERELETINMELSDAQHNREVQNQNRERGINQADQDYDATVDAENRNVDKTYQETMNAQYKLEDFYQNPPADEEETGGAGTSEEQLRSDFESKKSAYEDAVAKREEMIREKQKAVENARATTEKSSTPENTELKKQPVEEKLQKYKALQEQQGLISAPEDGVITAVSDGVVAGGVTTATSLMLLSGSEGGLKFVTNITKDEQKYVSLGDEVVLENNDSKEIAGFQVTSVTKSKEDKDIYEITVAVHADAGISLYERATMKVKGAPKTYPRCIPKEALHKNNEGKHYVLALVEKDTILGKQLEVEEVKVTVADSNDIYAAVGEMELTGGQKIVLSSDKVIEPGDRVRLVEDET